MDNWISQMFVNAVSAPVANAVASAGGMAGGAVGSVGNGINSIGAAIEKSIRTYGDGVKDYGNALQDWTKASGPRQGTASNPLGLSGNQVSGKYAFTGAPKSKPTEVKKSTPNTRARMPAPAEKKQAAIKGPQPVKKSAPSATKSSTPAKTPSKVQPAKPKGPTTGAAKGNTQRKTISAESRPQKPKVAAGAPKSSYGANSKAAANPLGL